MEEQIQQSWFKRNWKWVVPTLGCGTIIIAFIILALTIVFGVSDMLTNSEPSEYAIELANKNEKVKQEIGVPIERDGLPNGNFNFSGTDTGSIDMEIPIKGSKGNGLLVIIGEKEYGDWSYSELKIIVKKTNEIIELEDD